jgi:hypothetical protein
MRCLVFSSKDEMFLARGRDSDAAMSDVASSEEGEDD